MISLPHSKKTARQCTVASRVLTGEILSFHFFSFFSVACRCTREIVVRRLALFPFDDVKMFSHELFECLAVMFPLFQCRLKQLGFVRISSRCIISRKTMTLTIEPFQLFKLQECGPRCGPWQCRLWTMWPRRRLLEMRSSGISQSVASKLRLPWPCWPPTWNSWTVFWSSH